MCSGIPLPKGAEASGVFRRPPNTAGRGAVPLIHRRSARPETMLNAILPFVLQHGGTVCAASGNRFGFDFSASPVWSGNCACLYDVKLWKMLFGDLAPRGVLRHNFVIGPLSERPLFERKARIYYCSRCRWTFLVSDATVVALDEGGNPIGHAEGAARFASFELGPCPGAADSRSEADSAIEMPSHSPLNASTPARSADAVRVKPIPRLISIPGSGSLRGARS